MSFLTWKVMRGGAMMTVEKSCVMRFARSMEQVSSELIKSVLAVDKSVFKFKMIFSPCKSSRRSFVLNGIFIVVSAV